MVGLVNLIFSFCPSLPYLPLKCCVLLLLSGKNSCSSQLIETVEQLLTRKNGFIKHLDTSDCGTFCSVPFLLSPASLSSHLPVSCCSLPPPTSLPAARRLKAGVLQGSMKSLTIAIVPLLCITSL